MLFLYTTGFRRPGPRRREHYEWIKLTIEKKRVFDPDGRICLGTTNNTTLISQIRLWKRFLGSTGTTTLIEAWQCKIEARSIRLLRGFYLTCLSLYCHLPCLIGWKEGTTCRRGGILRTALVNTPKTYGGGWHTIHIDFFSLPIVSRCYATNSCGIVGTALSLLPYYRNWKGLLGVGIFQHLILPFFGQPTFMNECQLDSYPKCVRTQAKAVRSQS